MVDSPCSRYMFGHRRVSGHYCNPYCRPYRHIVCPGTCQVCDYVVVPIDVIIQQIQAFRGLDLTLKNYAATI